MSTTFCCMLITFSLSYSSIKWHNNACLFSFSYEPHNQSHLNSLPILSLFLIHKEACLSRGMSYQTPYHCLLTVFLFQLHQGENSMPNASSLNLTSILNTLTLESVPSVLVLWRYFLVAMLLSYLHLYGCTYALDPISFYVFREIILTETLSFIFHSPRLTLPIFCSPFC